MTQIRTCLCRGFFGLRSARFSYFSSAQRLLCGHACPPGAKRWAGSPTARSLRGRTNWQRPLLFDERCDSPAMAQIFPRALERLGFVVSFAARFCEVCLMKHRRFLFERPRCAYRVRCEPKEFINVVKPAAIVRRLILTFTALVLPLCL